MAFLLRLLLPISALIGLATSCIPPAFDAVQWQNMMSTPQPGQNDPIDHDAGDATAFGNTTATGWMHEVDAQGTGCSPIKPWPRDRLASRPGIVLIPYCWAQQVTDEGSLEEAWDLWAHRLGNPNQGTNHRLGGFYEYAPACYVNGGWNPAVPGDTVAIFMRDDWDVGVGLATVGYRPDDFDSTPGRHAIIMGTRDPDLDTYWEVFTITFAHELGHIFGLHHEHQRTDRGQYVHFACENIKGYDAAKALVESRAQHTMEQICKSATLSKLYNNFGATAFTTERKLCKSISNPGLPVPVDRTLSATYDMHSIMQYDSWGYSAVVHGVRVGVDKLPMVKWKHPYGANQQVPDRATADNADYIERNKVPTLLDISAVKELYPW